MVGGSVHKLKIVSTQNRHREGEREREKYSSEKGPLCRELEHLKLELCLVDLEICAFAALALLSPATFAGNSASLHNVNIKYLNFTRHNT